MMLKLDVVKLCPSNLFLRIVGLLALLLPANRYTGGRVQALVELQLVGLLLLAS